MSEEILRALTQLFAIITKQDGGVTEEERNYVQGFFDMELDRGSIRKYMSLYDEYVGYNKDNPSYLKSPGEERASMQDTLQTLNISKKINKTLSHKQKIIVLLRLLELLKADNQLTPLGVEIIDAISAIFNIPAHDYGLIKRYVQFDDVQGLDSLDFLVISGSNGQDAESYKTRRLEVDIDGELVILKISSVNMYLIKYKGADDIVMNGFSMKRNLAYLFSPGSTLKSPKGQASYYSDIDRLFETQERARKITFNAESVVYHFPNGDRGLHNINISEDTGSLVGIMGASGSGKTTLLNVLAGIFKPRSGKITINGIDYLESRDKLDGVIGYVAQDDLLMEELSVYDNLYYNAKLCLAQLSEEEIHKRVKSTLESLGLGQTSRLRVGSVLQKTISGGQRKRLNIALELIREPSILFVDEPTSGLSSRDSENVMDLLKELSLKGKIVFVVIHQPSSDIYKMFDKMIVMDTGGYQIYYGNPVEAISYFKEVTHHVDRLRSICHTCGNVNPEQIFNIVEAKVVNEYGQFTSKRRITPRQWSGLYEDNFSVGKVQDAEESPPRTLHRPGILKQVAVFTTRDFLGKIADRQYLLINILEAPLLALILATVVRYRSSPEGDEYMFRFNENLPGFFLMSVVVALFIGLTVSAEEIIKDRKILKREQFLNLSWSGYLVSKMIILFSLSAVQTLAFVVIAHTILQIKGMTLVFWLILFASSCMANMVGLNISSAFKSAVTVYILIPLILIPQIIFSGLMFSFDKLNEALSSEGRVPVIADFITSRWALEAMAVYQFKYNEYEKPYYEFDQEIQQSDFKASFWVPAMRGKVNFIANNFYKKEDSLLQKNVRDELALVVNEINREPFTLDQQDIDPAVIHYEELSPRIFLTLNQYLSHAATHYSEKANMATRKKEKLIELFENDERYDYKLNTYKDTYYNEKISDLVRNIDIKDRILEVDGRFLQQLNAIYQVPEEPQHLLNYRAHSYSPQKYFMGRYFNTHIFNTSVIWLMSFLFYISVYFKVPGKVVSLFSRPGN